MRSDYTNQTEKKKRNLLPKLLILIFVLAVAIAAEVYHSYRTVERSLNVEFLGDSPVLEIGEKRSSMSCISSAVGDVEPAAEYLDTDTYGDKTMTYTVTKPMYGGLLKPSKEYKFSYSVKDNVKPTMLWSGDGIILEKGTEFDIKNVIGYGDNADPEPTVEYKGKVDTDKIGEYPLHVTVTDESGNSIDWDMTVEVAESIPTYIDSDSSQRTPFADYLASYAGDGKSVGIDVSAWQDDIDFNKVKEAGCDFVMIRIGYTDEDGLVLDKCYEQNIKRATEAGLRVGLYMFSYDNSEEAVRKAAREVVDKLGGRELDLPIAFDWEDFSLFQHYKMSFTTLNNLYDVFAEEVGKSGYDCMLYGSKNYIESVWEKTDKRPIWLAHYTDKTDYNGPYKMWQLSSTGGIDGISGYVDVNVLYEK